MVKQSVSIKNMATTLVWCALIGANVIAADWPNYRGPNHDGISTETNWSHSNIKVVWKAVVGNGFSSVVVADGRAFCMGNTGKKKTAPGDTDVIYCFNANTGEKIWTHKYPCPLHPKYYPEGGTLSSPTIDGDRVFTLSKMGDLFCFKTATGEIIWQKKLNADLGFKLPTWHFSSSGIIQGDLIIYNIGTAGLALNKTTGQTVWSNGKSQCGYATPVPYEMDGKKCVAIFSRDTLKGVAVNGGNIIWSYPWQTKHYVNSGDPIVIGDKVFMSSGYSKGCSLIKVDGANAAKIWQNKEMRNHMNCSVLYKGSLYGHDESTLKCLDPLTGEEKWSHRGLGKGALTASADGRLIIMTEKTGELVIAKADPSEYIELTRAKILPPSKSWTVPVLANGKIYARNANGDVACADVAGK